MTDPREGGAWLERLPAIVAACAEQWSLTLGDPFPAASASVALPATTQEGHDAVLKVCFPHHESEHEADALRAWDGNGAVRLLAHDAERWALLLERCRPGEPLAERPRDEALDVLCSVLPRLWLPAAEPFRPLADEAAWWASYLPDRWEAAGRPFERPLLDAALEALRELPATQGEQVLLDQDLHPGNVLSAEREPWLVIDPKPLAGEREFSAAPIDSRRVVFPFGLAQPKQTRPCESRAPTSRSAFARRRSTTLMAAISSVSVSRMPNWFASRRVT